jgi:hypothetical protein
MKRCFPSSELVKAPGQGSRCWRGSRDGAPSWLLRMIPHNTEDWFSVDVAWTPHGALPEEPWGAFSSGPLEKPDGQPGHWIPLPSLFLEPPAAPPGEKGTAVAEFPWHLTPPRSIEELTAQLVALELAPPKVPLAQVDACVDDAVGRFVRHGHPFLIEAMRASGHGVEESPAWVPPAVQLSKACAPHATWRRKQSPQEIRETLASLQNSVDAVDAVYQAVRAAPRRGSGEAD